MLSRPTNLAYVCLLAVALVGCDGVLTRGDYPFALDAGGMVDTLPWTDQRPSPGDDQGASPSHDVGSTPSLDTGAPAPDAGAAVDTGASPDSSAPGPTVWRPKPGTTWQWQLMGTVDTNVNVTMYDIDLFDSSSALIAQLKSQGRVVICYFSAGSYEAWRPDAKDFPQSVRGSKMDGWDELWIDVRAAAVKSVMAKRLDLAKSKGCDGVEPDNVDGYANNTGFSLGGADQLAYNTWLAQQAHARGLSIGLKNDLDQVKALEPHFDWALNEECVQYNECDRLKPFIDAGKAVFHVEYSQNKSGVCGKTQPLKFDTLLKKLDLTAWYEACWK